MKDKYIISSYQEYLLFLYIYLANADFSVNFSEVDTILSKMEDLFPEDEDLEGIFVEVRDRYDKLDIYEIELLIKENYQLYKHQIASPERLFNDLFDIIVSDGIIQDYEIEAFDKIKKAHSAWQLVCIRLF